MYKTVKTIKQKVCQFCFYCLVRDVTKKFLFPTKAHIFLYILF